MIRAVGRDLGHDSGNVLIHIIIEHSLDHEYMRRALAGAYHTQIVDIAVAVQIQIGDHIRRIVQDALELFHCG